MPDRGGAAQQAAEHGNWTWSEQHPATAITTARHRLADETSLLIKVLYKVAGGALAAAASASPAAPVEFFLFFLQGVPALSSGYLLVSVDDLRKQRLLTFSGECGYDGDYSYVVPSEQAVPRLVELFESGQHLRFTAYPRGLHGPDDPRIGFLLPGSRRFADIRQRMLEQLRGRH